MRRSREQDSAALKARIIDLEAELKDYRRRAGAVTSVNSEIIVDFLEDGHVILPAQRLQAHLDRVRAEAGPKEAERYIARLEETGYRELFEWLFYEEFGIARVFDYRKARPAISFHRGRRDRAAAQRLDTSSDETDSPKYKATSDLFERHLSPLLDDVRPKRIVEVGGGWGATIKYLTERYGPEEYQNYEIDRHAARFVEERFGARSMPVDGETLHATATESIDLFVAMDSLFFMPSIKAYSYLDEAARVLRRDGMALFNLPDFEERWMGLRRLLDLQFPRRSFSFFPRQFLDDLFPEEHFRGRTSEVGRAGYFLYQKL